MPRFPCGTGHTAGAAAALFGSLFTVGWQYATLNAWLPMILLRVAGEGLKNLQAGAEALEARERSQNAKSRSPPSKYAITFEIEDQNRCQNHL